MPMTKERKKAQDKLRRKYKYYTCSDVRTTSLFREGVMTDTCNNVSDLTVWMDCGIWHYPGEKPSPIHIELVKYKDNGEHVPKETRYEKLGEIEVRISLEELDLIHFIAHEMSKENDWEGQIKRYKKRK